MTDPIRAAAPRHDWTRDEVSALFALDFPELIRRAQHAHRTYFDARDVQLSTLLSIKTGACPEDCAYCPQSVHFQTGLEREELLPLEQVIDAARRARAAGATRFCMGAAWRTSEGRGSGPRHPNDRSGQGRRPGDLCDAGHAARGEPPIHRSRAGRGAERRTRAPGHQPRWPRV